MADRRPGLWRALWLGCCLWLVGLSAHAAFPAPSWVLGNNTSGIVIPPGTTNYGSPEAACGNAAAYNNGLQGYDRWTFTSWTPPYCTMSRKVSPEASPEPGWQPVQAVNVGGTCPPNSTGTTTCTCNSGYSEDSQYSTASEPDICVENPPPDCPAPGTPHVYTEGHAPNSYTSSGAGRSQTCIGGCLMQGTGSATSQDGRSYTFPPLTNTGDNCTENENDEQPPVACSWPQVVNAAGTACETPTTTQTPPTVTQNPDGSTTERQTECTATTCTTTETNTPSGGGGGTTTTTQTGIREYCADHPNTALCADIGSLPPSGGGGDDDEGDGCMANPESENCGGPGTGVGDLYEGIGGDLQGLLGDFRDGALGTPMGSAVGGFFTVSAEATCPTYSADIPMIGMIEFDALCSAFGTAALAALRIAFLIVCAWYAFRVAIDN